MLPVFSFVNRKTMIDRVANTPLWDVCVIGGGATGLGIAVDAASRGLKTVLVERSDFAKGTSSKSTKLVHGGVRYLQQGNVKLVTEALKERGILLRNAPHLVKNQSFIIPNYSWWEKPYYGIGLKVYDWMAGSLGLGPSRFLSREETLAMAPTIDTEGLKGGVEYHDGQFDDARLAIHLAMTAADHGATLVNYFAVEDLIRENGKIRGVIVTDKLKDPGASHTIRATSVINATGVFADNILRMDQGRAEPTLSLSQGIHLVFDREFLPSDHAILIPRTEDKRVLFAVPWHGKIIAGTTDTPVAVATDEPVALEEEIAFVLEHIRKYFAKDPARDDIKSVFAGLRPLVKASAKTTAALSRDHHIAVSGSGLITVSGGKWTTYRKMAEDAVDRVVQLYSLKASPCKTESLRIHGFQSTADFSDRLYYYGSDKHAILSLTTAPTAPGGDQGHFTEAEVIWATRNEMCMQVEDFLARRNRLLLLDAKAAIAVSPSVARTMARELGEDERWIDRQVAAFTSLAKNYLPAG
ncbi:MAG TPA: glycerol-3-phosphate dehydrogenase/oxidase [Chitinophagaceae bacterium]